MFHKLKRIILCSKIEKKLFLEALANLYFAKIYLLFIPYKKWSKNLGKEENNHPCSAIELQMLKKALLRANKFSVWKNKCLVLSLAAKLMLNERNIKSKLHLGLKKEKSIIKAHAWVQIGEINFVSNGESYVKVM